MINPLQNFVYFTRDGINSPWVFVPNSLQTVTSYENDTLGLWKREIGREGLNFGWFHVSPNYGLIDPAPSNIIDTYIIQRGYYIANRLWLAGKTNTPPTVPTSFDLKRDYATMLDNKMISDTLILHSGKFKNIIGQYASPELRASIKVVPSAFKILTNNQIKSAIVDLTNKFFDISLWEFGETFYFSELASFIHSSLSTEIDSIVIVPLGISQVYGDLQQITANFDEIIQPSISVNDVEIIESLNPRILRQTL